MSIASLLTTLKPLMPFLECHDLAELSINQENIAWLDTGDVYMEVPVEFPMRSMQRLAELVASYTNQPFNKENPILSAVLPQGYRIQIVASPATAMVTKEGTLKETYAISIRKPTVKSYTLDDFEALGGFKPEKTVTGTTSKFAILDMLKEERQYKELLEHAVWQRRNILVVGGTYSGKTTLLNMLLNEIDKEERIIAIEDSTPELGINNKNQVRLFYSQSEQQSHCARDLITASLRLRPDRIILGEIRTSEEAMVFMQATNTGHAGSMTSLHADSADMALERLTNMLHEHYPNKTNQQIKHYLSQILDVVVHVKREPQSTRRYISEIKLLGG